METNNEVLRGPDCSDATGEEGGEEPGRERRGQGTSDRVEGGGVLPKKSTSQNHLTLLSV